MCVCFNAIQIKSYIYIYYLECNEINTNYRKRGNKSRTLYVQTHQDSKRGCVFNTLFLITYSTLIIEQANP